jgi:hypothetical protein
VESCGTSYREFCFLNCILYSEERERNKIRCLLLFGLNFNSFQCFKSTCIDRMAGHCHEFVKQFCIFPWRALMLSASQH